MIVGCGNEHQASRSRDGPTEIQGSRPVHTLCIELRDGPKRNLPGDFSRVGIDGPKLAPGRLLARPKLVIVPKTGVVAPRTMALILRIGPIRILDELSHIREIVGVHEKLSALGLEGHSRPVNSPDSAGELNRQLQSERSECPAVLHSAFGSEQVFAILFLLWSDAGNLIRREAHSPQRRRFQWEGLGWPRLFAGRLARRHWALLHAKDWFTVTPIQNEKQATLTQNRDRGNLHSIFL